MHVLFAYVVMAVALIAMFFLALPLTFAIICSAVLLFVFGTVPLWTKV